MATFVSENEQVFKIELDVCGPDAVVIINNVPLVVFNVTDDNKVFLGRIKQSKKEKGLGFIDLDKDDMIRVED